MPWGDGTGPSGQGPGIGRGRGVGRQAGRGRMGGNRAGAGPGGDCICPACQESRASGGYAVRLHELPCLRDTHGERIGRALRKEAIENHKRYADRVAFYRNFGYDLEKEREFIFEASLRQVVRSRRRGRRFRQLSHGRYSVYSA